MKILITGVAGFIGYHLAEKLLAESNNFYGKYLCKIDYITGH
jgi:UDP-glucuronate 4-epimerase